jgi:hypothetical protein
MGGRDGRGEAGEAGKHGDALALALRGIVLDWMMRRLVRRRHSFVHAMARRRVAFCVVRGLDDRLLRGGQPGAVRRSRFHPSGEDEGYGEREANADQSLDHAGKDGAACGSVNLAIGHAGVSVRRA